MKPSHPCDRRLPFQQVSLAAVLVGLALAAQAAAPASPAAPGERVLPDWIAIPASDGNMDFYLDRNSVRVHEDAVEFWDVVIFRKPVQKDEASGRWIKEKRTLRSVRCASQDQSLLRGSSFDEDGRLIEAMLLPGNGSSHTAVRAGTVASVELHRACAQVGQRVPDDAAPAGELSPALTRTMPSSSATGPVEDIPQPTSVPGTRPEPSH